MSSTATKKIKVNVEVEVPKDWIEFCTKYNDLFRNDHCGYWMREVEYDKKGHLAWFFEEDERDLGGYFIDRMPEDFENELHKDAVAAWKSGKPLPKNYAVLDEDVAVKAYKAGVEKWGIDWYENGDAENCDYVIQMALFNEMVYG